MVHLLDIGKSVLTVNLLHVFVGSSGVSQNGLMKSIMSLLIAGSVNTIRSFFHFSMSQPVWLGLKKSKIGLDISEMPQPAHVILMGQNSGATIISHGIVTSNRDPILRFILILVLVLVLTLLKKIAQ